MKHTTGILTILLLTLLWVTATGCADIAGNDGKWPDKLVVGTLYSPSGFFIMRNDTMGYDYDRICNFASSKGIPLEFKVASSLNQLISMLNNGEVDILATEVPNSSEYRKQVINCGAINETRPVLVQHTGTDKITQVTQLAGQEVCVAATTKYETLANHINSELGGKVNIRTIPADSVSTDDLLDMVSNNEIKYTIVDSDIVMLNASYYDDLDVTVTLGTSQTSSWAVSLKNKWLADSIDQWSTSNNATEYSKTAMERYFKKSKVNEEETSLVNEIPHLGGGPGTGTRGGWGTPKSDGPLVHKIPTQNYPSSSGHNSSSSSSSSSTSYAHYSGTATTYEQLFMRYAGESGFDWHVLRAIAKVESNFNSNAVSWAGARGLMQIMPSTARGHGVDPNDLFDPEVSVRVAAQCLRSLNNKFLTRIPNREQRIKFVLASYNAGAGHVMDAMALAQKYGKNPQVWEGNVEEAILWKSSPQYYNDPVCRFGYCRGRETVNYVIKVQRNY
ncbi:MAG: transglycosylase SLT domain-containing protein [Muribaculaceae bacterium]|nr:transglycosylase SLT domain-containing protein [Muribaculaceae bacterium]